MRACAMRERPILFNGAIVRAVLSGAKTQTRRVMKPQPADDIALATFPNPSALGWRSSLRHSHGPTTAHFCPFGQPGDRLWVREAHAIFPTHGQHRTDGERWGPWGGLPTTVSEDGKQIAYYREGFDRCDPGRWRPSIHMPRWACRILLEITAVRVERLQAITEADAIAEGAPARVDPSELRWQHYVPHSRGFIELWNSTGGDWDSNPWVWVLGFKRLEVPHA